ncbi:hypothetical protein [Acinetobacter gerneri]|uniref:Uncharacterized protein n=1 Tax=Acinetobacter gerneri DSM 14967 = CIP 107464 = MTCC 9824 TaxID=1120926 RepID=N8Y7W7_9GAMM|nr:hypothetical protein [Acinetobacter gerneri]ENV32726.1 hypothetical protein F960_03233 [Acinetobacter gerneri DSM 14967 = CIP 107464 = MTCC 9824]EPR80447.1 hypothetical protein L289_0629 [Acinetobacter gerneri DSM 14967 = CIP 107464 = MTCC 9824]
MDKIYFLSFKVKQAKVGGQFEKYSNVQATCWVKAFSAISAFRESIYFLKKEQWKVTSLEENIVQVTREMFIGKDIGLDQFDKAKTYGFSIFYVGVDENLTAPEFVSFDNSEKIDIAQFLKNKNSMDRHEFCLHPKAGSDCDEKIIRAHSIQNNQSLSKIAANGHVYQLDNKYQHEVKTYLDYKKIGINKASVFKGFCKKHDNEIFEPIDNYLLEPTAEQIFLYAYRSICKEIYQKYKVIQALKENIQLVNSEDEEQLGWYLLGNQKGYEELIKIKKSYDETFLNKSFEKDILYVIFYSKKTMNLAFSSLIYPDFDFQNNLLQDLGDLENDKDLITYFSAPMNGGWGYVFAWHIKIIQYVNNLQLA